MTTSEKREEKPARKHANYLLVFILLAILTGTEIAVSQMPLPRAPILIPLSIIKASLVALFYMHLRTDRRVFSFFFGMGIVFGIGMLTSFVILLSTHAALGH